MLRFFLWIVSGISGIESCSQPSLQPTFEGDLYRIFYFHLAFTLESILLQSFLFFSALSAPWTVSLFLSFYIPFCLFSLSHPIKSPGSLLSPLQPLFALVLISGLGSKASPVSDASPHLSPLHVSSKQLSALPSSLGKRFPCLPQLVLSQIPPFKQSSPLKLYFAAMPSELLCDSAAAESCHVNCV